MNFIIWTCGLPLRWYLKLAKVFLTSKSNILKGELNIVSKNNILKREDKLKSAPITLDAKLPILINRNQDLAKLIVWDVHLKSKYVGCKQALTEIRQKF